MKPIRLVVLMPTDMTPNGDYRDFVRGEWWIDTFGASTFADSQIGDLGHEQIAINAMLDADVVVHCLQHGRWANRFDDDDLAYMAGEFGVASLEWQRLTDEEGEQAAGSLERWLDLKKDARAAYAKHEGAIMAVNLNFAAYRVTEATMKAIRNFLDEEISEHAALEDVDASDEMCIEQMHPRRYTCLPIADFMLLRRPTELWRG